MDQYLIKQSKLKGEITIPPSKSHTLRAILFGTLCKGKSIIHGFLNSPDAQAMIQACRHFGARLSIDSDRIEIEGISGNVLHAEDVINAGNSGIVLRFCSAVGALSSLPVVITGDYSIRHHRPMKPILTALQNLHVRADSMRGDNFAPVVIQGPIQPGTTQILGEDSQGVSALLIASSFASGTIVIEVMNPGEKPWVDLTLKWMDRLGVTYKREGYERFTVSGRKNYLGFEYQVPGDLSSAAFPIAAALITNSEILLRNVDLEDAQGDKELVFLLEKMGAQFIIDSKNKTLSVKKGRSLKGCVADINNFIDALPILAVIGCFADGETSLINAKVASQKECNRISCIASELKKMGADIVPLEDGLRIRKSSLYGASLNSYYDHRMAMALTVAGFAASGETKISPIDCIAKTFPTFFEDFYAMGACIEVK